MEPTTYGIVSIVPVIVLIVVALITKRTFESLLIATLLALILGYKGDWFYALIEQIQTVSAENVWVLLVVGLLGGLVGVLEKSRAAMGFTGVLSRFATTKKRSLLAEWLLSVVLFVDDYLNILATGSITKRLNDSHRIHRTMTAYVIGSTSAPVVVLIPLSSWSIYYASLIDTTGIVPEGGSATLVYIQSIPFMFYPMLCLLVLLLVITGVIPLFGPMRKFQKEAEETGVLFPDGKPVGQDDADPFPEEPPAKSRHTAGLWDLVLPIAVLVAATIIFDIDVLTGVVVARKDFVEQNPQLVSVFLSLYEKSVTYANEEVEGAAKLIGEYDIVPEAVAQKALPECNITFIAGDEMQAKLSAYLQTLLDQNPKSIGGQLPGDDFYYLG